MLAKQHKAISARSLQQALEQIRDITSARVIMDDREQIAEIHLLGPASRKPKQIVRDTETLLHARFGIAVDYRKISIAQLETGDQTPDPCRLRLVSVTSRTATDSYLEVTLWAGTNHYVGTAQVPDAESPEAEFTSVARATADAVQAAVHGLVQLDIEHAMTVRMEGRRVALVGLRASSAGHTEFLTGTCLVRHCVLDAVARATLDALNRRLSIWSQRGSVSR